MYGRYTSGKMDCLGEYLSNLTVRSCFHAPFLCTWMHRSTDSGTLFIDSSTTEPHTSIEMSKEAEKLGVTFMDAPVSGGQYTYLRTCVIYVTSECVSMYVHAYMQIV